MDKNTVCYLDGTSLHGETYIKFMEFLFSKSDMFTYTKMDTENPIDYDDKVYKEKIEKFETLTNSDFKKKFFTHNYGISFGSEKQVFVLSLKSTTLKSYIKNKKDISKWIYPECVEDIGFYINNVCVFESCSHEEIYRFYADDEDIEHLTKIGVKIKDKNVINKTDVPTL